MNKSKLLIGAAAIAAIVIVIAVPLAVTGKQAHDRAASDREAMAALADAASPGGRHHYKYFAAEEVQWDFAPSGENLCEGGAFSGEAALFTINGTGRTYKKARYVEYTGEDFEEKVPIPEEDKHMGLLGPLLLLSPGDRVTLQLRNRLAFNVGMQPTGLAPLPATTPGANGSAGTPNWAASNAAPFAFGARPNATITYEWLVPDTAAPTPDEPDLKLWMYHSNLYPDGTDNAGLLGPILVGRRGNAAPSGRDIVTVMQNINEGASPFLDDNLAGRTAQDLGLSEGELEASLVKHVINGFMYCNTPGLTMKQGETVRWHLANLGSEGDMHNAHWHGNTLLLHGHRADQVKLVPGTLLSTAFETRSPGTWLFHCHVNDHLRAGMRALYTVEPSARSNQETLTGGTLREHFIAAEEVVWDYTPLRGNACPVDDTSVPAAAPGPAPAASTPPKSIKAVTPQPDGVLARPFDDQALTFTSNATGLVGSRYLKAVFVEYIDGTFTQKVQRPAEEAYMGLLGPTLRAEVGDTLRVTFLNRLRYHASMHPHGVRYSKSSEGSPYQDGTTGADKADDAVPPGSNHTFVWEVPASAGPGPQDLSTHVWMYHSHTDEIKDTLSGLVGAIVVGRAGAFRRQDGGALGPAADVDQEAVLFFSVMNERGSLYWQDNLALLAEKEGVTLEEVPALMAAAAEAVEATGAKEEAPAPEAAYDDPVEAGDADVEAGGEGEGEGAEAEDDGEAGEPDLMHAINGYIYCNGPPLPLTRGLNVRFHVIALGTEIDLHTLSLTDASWSADGQRVGALGMMPGAMQSVDVAVTARPGPSLLQCRVADHVLAGMRALALVQDGADGQGQAAEAVAAVAAAEAALPPLGTPTSGESTVVVRPYFIAAQEERWDYAPLRQNNCSASGPSDFAEGEALFALRTATTIGSVYTKAIYRRFTDGSFTEQVPMPAHHGLLGPLVAAEVGDVVEVTFFNNASFPANLRFDGGLVPLKGGAGGVLADAVQPGAQVVYRLFVPESAGPGPADLSTVAYPYVSSVDPAAHPIAGLVGALIVGRPGAFDPASFPPGTAPPAVPRPVDAELLLPLLVAVMDENSSPFLEANMAAAGVAGVNPADEEFAESNLMHTLNGFVFCNMRDVAVPVGARVRVVTLTVGTEWDLHSMQFAGHVLTGSPAGAARGAMEPSMPAMAMTADTVSTEPGRWNFACAVHDHVEAGMQGAMTVA